MKLGVINPVFVIDRSKVKEIILSVANKGDWYTGYAFGESSPEGMISLVDGLPPCIEDSNNLNMSKVVNKIKEFETSKMPGNANCSINLIIKLMNECKFSQS